jgi:putative ABC transport system permease protein
MVAVSVSSAVSLVLAIALFLLIVAVASWLGRLQVTRESAWVVLRAAVQLVAVAAVIRLVFTTPVLAPVYLAGMLVVAAATSSTRLRRQGVAGTIRYTAAAIAAGAGATVAIVLATTALPADVHQIVPFAAQIIGGTMTATTLASLRMVDDAAASWPEVEGWLALGATPTVAVRDVGRRAAARALVPALDQTRNVGLVVLPGAFVGLLLAGASPLEAGRLQLLVLVGLLAAETVAAASVVALLAHKIGAHRPGPAVASPAPAPA